MIGFNDCIWKMLPLGNRRGNEQQLNQLKLTIEQHHHHHISKMDRTALLHLMRHCKEKDSSAAKYAMGTTINIIKKQNTAIKDKTFLIEIYLRGSLHYNILYEPGT